MKPHVLLAPLTLPYRVCTTVRNWLYDRELITVYNSPLPVISVGNVTTGGTGKSPVAMFLAQNLASQKRKPVVLLRGYKGRIAGPHRVSETDDAVAVGDEACMHRRLLPESVEVVIARERVAGCSFIQQNALGDCIILDDGFQHRKLARDLDIVLIDASSDEAIAQWQGGKILPRGSFREERNAAIKRAGCVFVVVRTRTARSSASWRVMLGIPSSIPMFTVEIHPRRFVDAISGESKSLVSYRGINARAICGIAKPEAFSVMLSRLGVNLDRFDFFADHYVFSSRDWERVGKDFEGPILTTTKDAVKLRQFVDKPGVLVCLELGVRFCFKAEYMRFWHLVTSMLDSVSIRTETT